MKSGVLGKLFSNDEGGYAIAFALAVLPLMAGFGVSLDYVEASHLQRSLRSAADTAALATVHEYMRGQASGAELDRIAKGFVVANLGEQYAKDTEVRFVVPAKLRAPGAVFRVEAKLTYHPIMAPVYAALTGANVNSFDFVIE